MNEGKDITCLFSGLKQSITSYSIESRLTFQYKNYLKKSKILTLQKNNIKSSFTFFNFKRLMKMSPN